MITHAVDVISSVHKAKRKGKHCLTPSVLVQESATTVCHQPSWRCEVCLSQFRKDAAFLGTQPHHQRLLSSCQHSRALAGSMHPLKALF